MGGLTLWWPNLHVPAQTREVWGHASSGHFVILVHSETNMNYTLYPYKHGGGGGAITPLLLTPVLS